MARKPIKIKCKILEFKDNPAGGQNVYVECRIGQRVWIAERFLHYDRPISFEEFKREFAKTKVIPEVPEDMLAYVKEEADKPFEIQYTPSD